MNHSLNLIPFLKDTKVLMPKGPLKINSQSSCTMTSFY